MERKHYKTIIFMLVLVFLITLGFIFARNTQASHKAKIKEIQKNGEITDMPNTIDTAAFAAGCFWGVEETFMQIKGVKNTTVGYMGGTTENPTYKDVCTDGTGHAETVLIEYDPSEVSYNDLLKVFWENHNPTRLNKQGPDVGTQYRSVIFYFKDDQKTFAEKSKDELQKSGKYSRDIVTQIVPAATFWKAEDYHQKYLQKHGLTHCNY